jgi:UDP-N-acetylmuramyl pentapeptide phosphotransferase/UDP-N-acetylglucosamine-1-phosphate transferase
MAGLFTALAIVNLNTVVPAVSVLLPGISSHSSVLNLGFLLLAAMPAFLGGLFEDITKKVGVLERLLLTMLSGCIGAWLLGAVLPRLDIPGIDAAFAWFPFAVVFTLFAVGGIANAINIIDGYNGLAGGFSIIVLLGLAFVGHQTGDALITCLALGLAGSILGFLVWNWPAGKIFLGDGGAYLIGFMLAELSVLLVVRNPDVSPWFPLALLAYPVFETIYSIYRRGFVNDASPGQADNQHLHQLIHDYLVPKESKNGDPISRLECNSRVAKYLWAPASAMALLASVFWSSTPMLVACVLSYCVFYVFNYRRIVKSEFQLQKPSV